MPTPPLEEPTIKITFLGFDKDMTEFKQVYGQGWTGQLREVIRNHLRIRRGVIAEQRKGITSAQRD